MINVGLVGAGTMGSFHARVVSTSDRARLARVIDGRKEVGTAVAERYETEWSDSLGALEGLDAVIIAASDATHRADGVPRGARDWCDEPTGTEASTR